MDPIIEQQNIEIQIEEVRIEADTEISSNESLRSNVELMFKYAVNTGKELPTNLNLKKNSNYQELIADYNTLMKVISPSTPESIRYINAELTKKGSDSKWYLIPVYSKCIILAILALVTLIGVSLLPIVDKQHQAEGMLDASGFILLSNLIFICAASLLGVMFYLLKTIGDKIKNSTLLPSDSIELNSSIIIGVIAGFVISELFSLRMSTIDNEYVEIQRMTLALLGGFSSDAIFSLLQVTVNKFKSLLTD
ncbi:MAG: hypothetical protein HKO89_06775 [Saprospiraceae bacterium]|nr:hypothetical protein [Bacteroidia bacterium]NNK90297.1 hypothetical protein [Saprospiraceae bacterium]